MRKLSRRARAKLRAEVGVFDRASTPMMDALTGRSAALRKRESSGSVPLANAPSRTKTVRRASPELRRPDRRRKVYPYYEGDRRLPASMLAGPWNDI